MPQPRDQDGPVMAAISTSTRGNATAFGFSITITATFGALQSIEGTPSIGQILLFAVASALVVGLLEAAVSRGFRRRSGVVHAEVRMLGTALNFVSVGIGVGAGAGVASLVTGTWAWPLAAAAATLFFLAGESAATLLAEFIQKGRGDPDAEDEQD
jgi:hypothetical protein